MPKHTTEKYQDFEIEWIDIPSFNYGCGHGIELHYKKGKKDIILGFIEGFNWHHNKKGPCRIYILSKESKNWEEMINESAQKLNELKEAVYELLKKEKMQGKIKNNIYGWVNG